MTSFFEKVYTVQTPKKNQVFTGNFGLHRRIECPNNFKFAQIIPSMGGVTTLMDLKNFLFPYLT